MLPKMIMYSKIKIKIQEIGTEYLGLVFVIILTKNTEANILLLSNFNGMSCFAAKTDKKNLSKTETKYSWNKW